MTSAKDSASEIFTMLCVEELGWQCRTLECQPNMNNPGDKCKKQRSFQTPEPIGTPKPCAGPSGSNLKSSTSSPTAYALQGTMGTGGPKAVSGQLRELSCPRQGRSFPWDVGSAVEAVSFMFGTATTVITGLFDEIARKGLRGFLLIQGFRSFD